MRAPPSLGAPADALTAVRVAFAKDEPDAANGVNQLDRIVDVHLAAQGHVDVDDVVERRRPRRLFRRRARVSRAERPALVAKEVFEQLEFAHGQLDRVTAPGDLAVVRSTSRCAQ